MATYVTTPAAVPTCGHWECEPGACMYLPTTTTTI